MATDQSPKRLVIHQLDDNPFGWGPVSVPVQQADIPYAPYNKGDKLGKAADWTTLYRTYNRFNQGSGNALFSYVHTEDDENFTLVDSTSKPKDQRFNRNSRYGRSRGNDRNRQNQNRTDRKSTRGKTLQRGSQKRSRGGFRRIVNQHYGDSKRIFEASVEVQEEWKLMEHFDVASLDSLLSVEDGIELMTCGELEFMDKSFDNLAPKDEKDLLCIERTFFHSTTSDDPIIRQLIQQNTGNVFGTDSILALLMACPRSVYPWDIVVQRIGGKLIFDKRANSQIDLVSVNETSHETQNEERDTINAPQNLAQEATLINRYFSQQILVKGSDQTVTYDPNPFKSDDSEDVASVAYRYRKWNLGDGIELVSRCEIDGVREYKGQNKFITINALNEYDTKITGWRQKLDTQRGAVLATELKNNSNKLARWILEAILAGADQMILGYVSRVHTKDPYKHTILGTQTYVPNEFAQQITLNVSKAWGILKSIIEKCMALEDGKYLLMKEPNKAELLLYSVPQDAFLEEEEEEDDDEEDIDDIDDDLDDSEALDTTE